MIALYIAAGTLDSISKNTQTMALHIVGAFFILLLAVSAMRHIATGNHGGLFGLIILGLVGGFFIFDPTGVESLIKSTVHALGG